MRDNLALLARYLSISVRGQMQYRASFLMMTLAHLLTTVTEFVAVWALFARFGSLRGWTLPQVALFYGSVNIAFSLADGFGRGFDLFGAMVKSGDFDRLLLRPRSTALQVAGQDVILFRVGRLLQGLVVLVWASARLAIVWSVAKVALVLAMILGGACLFYGLFVLQATLAFWTVETLEIMNAVTYGGTETAQFPLSIYRPWFRAFFTYVIPLACINILPAQALMGHTASLVAWLSPVGGVLFMLVALWLWRFGTQHYCSTGS